MIVCNPVPIAGSVFLNPDVVNAAHRAFA